MVLEIPQQLLCQSFRLLRNTEVPFLPIRSLALDQQEDQQESFEEDSAPELWIFEILFDLTLRTEMLYEDLDELR